MRMNIRGLLIPIIGLFILQGCENPGLVGLDDQTFVNGTFTDTSTVLARTEATGNVRTDNLLRIRLRSGFDYIASSRVIGYFNDPIMGTTEARAFTQVLTPGSGSSGVDFGENPVLDSAVLVLRYADIYGDTLSTMNVVVEELMESMGDSMVEQYSNKTFVTGQLLASKSFTFSKDSISIQAIVKDGPDSTILAPPQLRVKLNTAFMQSKILDLDTAILNDQDKFLNHFKGISIRTDTTMITSNGALVSVDMSNSNQSYLMLYYRTNDNADTLRRLFGINNFASQSSYFAHNYTGTAIAAVLADTTYNSAPQNYVQPLAGVHTAVRFPYLENLGEGKNISVNKAELILTTIPGTVSPYEPAPRLLLHQGQTEEGFVKTVFAYDPVLLAPNFNGFYYKEDGQYHFNITRLVQGIIDGSASDDSLSVSVLSTIGVSSGGGRPPQIAAAVPGITRGQRVVFGGGNHPQYRAKLEITYSE